MLSVKVLAISDKVVDLLYSPCLLDKFGDVDMVLSCGDLPYYYLEYIVSLLNVPLLYVHGNHDPAVEYWASGAECTGPNGGTNLHGHLVQEHGLTVAGLEGSIRYKPTGEHQYTDFEMWLKALEVAPALLTNQLKTGRRLDILLTHAPPFGIHNGSGGDLTHVGFRSFLWLMHWFKPRYLLHGHRHVYNPLEVTETQYEQTTVVNVYPYRVFEIDIENK
jgi:Icc-related predicted phosphoesterase